MNDLIIIASTFHASANPFDGVSINLDFLGAAFKGKWQLWLGGVWGLGLVALAFFSIKAIVGLRNARNNKNPTKAEHSKGVALGTGISFALLLVLPMIVGGIITATGNA